MSGVSYFQRFSQPENHATNNTLLLMRYFHQKSPRILEAAFSALMQEDLRIGWGFSQQTREAHGVPDALIVQAGYELHFETKRGGDLDRGQMERHIASIQLRGGARKILFGLTRSRILEKERIELVAKAKEASITFVAVTFSDIFGALRERCATHDVDLLEILDDYEDYLQSQNLLDRGEFMTVVACGTSLAENIKHRLYFEPPSRPSKAKSKFIGLYRDKCVRYIGRIACVVTGSLQGDAFQSVDAERGECGGADRARIASAIADCSYYPELKTEAMRYYLFDEFEETELRKVSKGGIWGPRRLSLSDWLNYASGAEYETRQVAAELSGKTFE